MKARRGAVLLFVMGIFVLLSYVLMHIIEYAQIELKSRASNSEDLVLRSDAYDALYAVIAELEEYREIDKGLYSAEQGWGACFEEGRITLPGGSVAEVKVVDVMGKIPLANLTADELQAIFEELDIPTGDRRILADCLLDWTDTDEAPLLNGAEKDDYGMDEPIPPNRPLKSLSELFYIKNFRQHFYDDNNFPNERYEKFSRIVSLEEFREVNLNSASEEVLAAMLRMEGEDYDFRLYEAIRGMGVSVTDGQTWVKSLAEIDSRGGRPPKKNAVCETSRLKIEVKIRRGIGEYFLSAVYGSPDDGAARTSAADNSDAASLSSFKILNVYEKSDGAF